VSVFTYLSDHIADTLAAASIADLVGYGRASAAPELVARYIDVQLGPSRQSEREMLFGVTTWITEIQLTLHARPVASVHRTAMHAADELMSDVLRVLRWGDAGDAYTDELRARGAQGYTGSDGDTGFDSCAPVLIDRETKVVSVPVGVIAVSLWIKHMTNPGTLTPIQLR
jgi:hypothetical protein